MAVFHSRTGTLVTLSNGNRTAQRNHPTQEFNNGVVLSADALRDNQIFEVKIDKKVNSWSGSIEIGVTTCDPNNLSFPISATGFREGTWVMSGSSILKDGHSMIEEYGRDLDQLSEGDRVGVMRSSQGVLHFYVNGMDQGPAATGIPSRVYAVVDMYGKCAQVSIVDSNSRDAACAVNAARITNDIANELANEFLAELSNQIANDLAASRDFGAGVDDERHHSNDRLTFHERCGTLVKLSNSRRTAERRRPMDEFNNGVVMTNRPLRDEEVFEIRLDRLVDKWSGSIEVGITTHNPNNLEFPATMTNMRSGSTAGTIMMSGCGILTNGKGTRREYGQYNLDELTEGDIIGLVRKNCGALHYFINGVDQGIAATSTPRPAWGVVDLYGMAVKVTMLDRADPAYPNNPPVPERRANSIFRQYPDMYDEEPLEEEDGEKLLFNPHCGAHAAVINSHRTAHRPNALDDFNNGVVLTNRCLRANEVFEVRLERMVDKWAGSIEIGVTLHSPEELDYPSTMTNIRSGTWMMTGNGVMHNGTTIIDEYGQNLDRLKVDVGDRVGVVRKPDGTLHFFVNGVDQGPAASSVPEMVYGVIDLYGQAAQATIVDQSEVLSSPDLESSVFTDVDDVRFHHLHGHNATVLNNGKTAARPNATGEFNDAIVMSSRPLRDNELFEVVIERMVDRWSGSIEAGVNGCTPTWPDHVTSLKQHGVKLGVTLIKPEDLDFPNTMTDIEYDTWMLSGSAIMQDGSTIRNGYPLDLDAIVVGSRIGMMRCSDGSLHFFLNGEDQGVACQDIAPGVYAVVDLYGQCAQVSITSGSGVLPTDNHIVIADIEQSLSSALNSEITHRFSNCCGKNIVIKNNGCTANRVRNFNHGVVFSSEPLKYDELFEMKVEEVSNQWSGSIHIGLTTMAISDSTPLSQIPASAEDITSKVTWIVSGSEVKKSGKTIKENYAPSLERLEVGNRIGIRRCSDGTLHIYLNGEDLGIAASNIPKNVFAVIDLYGSVESVSIISSAIAETPSTPKSPPVILDQVDSQADRDQDHDTMAASITSFQGNHGKNILLSNNNLTARRVASYNQGIVVSHKPLTRKKLFQVRIDKLNPRWSASMMLGVLGFSCDRYNFPVSAISIKKSSLVIHGDSVFSCGCKVRDLLSCNLDSVQVGQYVGLLVDDENCLHLYINGVDQGVAVKDVPTPCFGMVDLYGQCEQVTIVSEEGNMPPLNVGDDREKADIDDVVKEKQGGRMVCDLSVMRNCEYQNLCSRLRTSLGLPDGYFDMQYNMCYCETCHKMRGDDFYVRRGDPPSDYAVPFGWCRFVLRAPCKAHSLNVFEKWHAAYHGTRVEVVRRILDYGDLLLPGDPVGGKSILIPQPQVFTEKAKPDSFGGQQIFFSPTIRYAGASEFAPKHRFTDLKTKKLYQARVAFQVWVKPGSYKVGPQTIEASDPIDPKFNNSELEWSTKERGSTMLYALLLRVE